MEKAARIAMLWLMTMDETYSLTGKMEFMDKADEIAEEYRRELFPEEDVEATDIFALFEAALECAAKLCDMTEAEAGKDSESYEQAGILYHMLSTLTLPDEEVES